MSLLHYSCKGSLRSYLARRDGDVVLPGSTVAPISGAMRWPQS